MAEPFEAAVPHWLRIGRCAADPRALTPDLAVLAAIAPRWRDLACALIARGVPADLSSPAKVLALVVGATTRPEVRDAFASLDLAGTFGAVEQRAARLAATDQPWSALLRPAATRDEPIVLTVPPRVGPPPIAGAATLTLADHGTATLRCTTGASWPATDDGEAGLFGIALTGIATIAGIASAAEIDLLFRPTDADESVAALLLRCLPALPDPFDDASIQRATALAGLVGVAVRTDRE